MRITESQLRKIVREEILGESAAGGKLARDIAKNGLEWAVEKWGPDIAAVYLSLPVDMPIERVARKLNVVRAELGKLGGDITPAEAYESDDNHYHSNLRTAIRTAMLSGRAADKQRAISDRYY
jgi:hypothetical protein